MDIPKTNCDKCDGDGKQYVQPAHEFFRQWREQVGLTQGQVFADTDIDITQISRFEHGRMAFGEQRLRRLAELYTRWATRK